MGAIYCVFHCPSFPPYVLWGRGLPQPEPREKCSYPAATSALFLASFLCPLLIRSSPSLSPLCLCFHHCRFHSCLFHSPVKARSHSSLFPALPFSDFTHLYAAIRFFSRTFPFNQQSTGSMCCAAMCQSH